MVIVRQEDLQLFGFNNPAEAFFIALMLLVAVLGALVTVQALIQRVQELRDRPAPPKRPPWRFCRRCGYNLICSRERCPECGEPIPAWPRERANLLRQRGSYDADGRSGE